ncbi:hypothetical protein MXMO3_01675 [Maritalea myrionectae]|uniref:Uncharacterized protein n=1 Tax=Maritalea myrionectae TaxID=454601 RepID=A0A2R4MDT4_9HYPH|nr:hypothetical protein [Maritalea myrionectae]AVX04201.1 hypothetical protein MXMO3_01675 [Maritalea myrionectae]
MSKLEQYKTFVAVIVEGSEVLETFVFTDIDDLLDQATCYGIDCTILGHKDGEESADDVTVEVAHALADWHYERNADAYCFEGAKTESPCQLITLHADTYLDGLINEVAA